MEPATLCLESRCSCGTYEYVFRGIFEENIQIILTRRHFDFMSAQQEIHE
jgi:hypothetical protein